MGSKRRKVLASATALLIVLAAAGFYFLASSRSELAEELRLARAEGIPLTPDELRAKLATDGDNAHADYRKAAAILASAKGLRNARADYYRAPRTLSLRNRILIELDRVPAFEGSLQQASKKPRFDPGTQWEQGYGATGLRQSANLRNFVRYLNPSAEAAVASGKSDRAIELIASMLAISRHIAQEPTIIANLSGQFSERSALNTLHQFLRKFGTDKKTLLQAQELLDSLAPLPDPRMAYFGELVLANLQLNGLPGMKHNHLVRLSRETRMGSGPVPPANTTDQVWAAKMKVPGFAERLQKTVVREYRLFLTELGKNPADADAFGFAAVAARQRIAALDNDLREFGKWFFPNLEIANTRLLWETRRRIDHCAVRMLLDRLETGKVPEKLPDYGAMSIDPFSRKPLIFKRLGKGFLLYSIGPNRVDDAGGKGDDGIGWPTLPAATS